jgi:hypothetical protein
MDALIRSCGRSKRWLRRLLILAVFLPEISLPAEPTANAAASAEPSNTTMKTFVIIFRQGPRQLTDFDKQHRAEETTEWALRQNGAGHKLDPHILAPESVHRGPETSTANSSDAWPVTALLFLEARDLSEATQVAESHPALRYGANVEVRPWGRPIPSQSPGPASATP